MKNIKRLGAGILFFFMLISISFVFHAGKELFYLPKATDYTDLGIHTFVPRNTYPTQKETYHRKKHTGQKVTTQTVYKIEYHAIDGSGYTWVMETLVSSEANKIMQAKQTLDRRVLLHKEDKTYITIDGKETLESYAKGIRKKDMITINLAGAYILIYGATRFILYQRKKQ